MNELFAGCFMEFTVVVFHWCNEMIFHFETSRLGEKLELFVFSRQKTESQRLIAS